ncbi:MAG: tRNA pseudouridine(38-40) synthase TruA [Burkholderiales bacterium]|jgi:tRNA pseudouridine38-40 synthase|nr:tRNA pseudouridine(38-40) synthase TruA [Burkholderiales bacterium]
MTTSQRYAFLLEYDGAGFCGWQTQRRRLSDDNPSSCPTVQEALELALARIAGAPVSVVAAGRTDTGVHATAQMVHADIAVHRPLSAWSRGVNTYLPDSVSVLWARPVSADFHARFCATSRHYVYWLLNRPTRPALWAGKAGWYHRALDVEAMQMAANALLGTHDFSSFRASLCQAASPVKTLTRCGVTRHDDWIRFEFSANAFLHHMVRNIIGALIWVGNGQKPPTFPAELLEKRDRTLSAPTFSAAGLYLSGVDYPPVWGLPQIYRAPVLGIAKEGA